MLNRLIEKYNKGCANEVYKLLSLFVDYDLCCKLLRLFIFVKYSYVFERSNETEKEKRHRKPDTGVKEKKEE